MPSVPCVCRSRILLPALLIFLTACSPSVIEVQPGVYESVDEPFAGYELVVGANAGIVAVSAPNGERSVFFVKSTDEETWNDGCHTMTGPAFAFQTLAGYDGDVRAGDKILAEFDAEVRVGALTLEQPKVSTADITRRAGCFLDGNGYRKTVYVCGYTDQAQGRTSSQTCVRFDPTLSRAEKLSNIGIDLAEKAQRQ